MRNSIVLFVSMPLSAVSGEVRMAFKKLVLLIALASITLLPSLAHAADDFREKETRYRIEQTEAKWKSRHCESVLGNPSNPQLTRNQVLGCVVTAFTFVQAYEELAYILGSEKGTEEAARGAQWLHVAKRLEAAIPNR